MDIPSKLRLIKTSILMELNIVLLTNPMATLWSDMLQALFRKQEERVKSGLIKRDLSAFSTIDVENIRLSQNNDVVSVTAILYPLELTSDKYHEKIRIGKRTIVHDATFDGKDLIIYLQDNSNPPKDKLFRVYDLRNLTGVTYGNSSNTRTV